MAIAERRHARLIRQYEELADEFQGLDSQISQEELSGLLEPVGELLEKVETRKELVEGASSTAFGQFYDRYVSAMDDADIRLDNLHEVIGYLELHSRQRSESSEIIDDIQNVCREICRSFNLSASILPIIWMSYATLPIGHEQMNIYCLFLPRHSQPRQYQPLIAHEIGHALYDQIGISREFRDRVWEIDEEWGPDRGEFAEVWDEWYVELFCDAAAVICFGPAYIQAISDYLHNSKPYNVRPNQGHPPQALRLEFIETTANDTFPETALQVAEPTLSEVNEHLSYQEIHRGGDYLSYLNSELLDIILEDVREQVSNDLIDVMNLTTSSQSLSDVDEDLFYRVKINRAWFQNGG